MKSVEGGGMVRGRRERIWLLTVRGCVCDLLGEAEAGERY